MSENDDAAVPGESQGRRSIKSPELMPVPISVKLEMRAPTPGPVRETLEEFDVVGSLEVKEEIPA